MTSLVLGKLIRYGSEGFCGLNRGRPPQGTGPSAASRRLAADGLSGGFKLKAMSHGHS